MKEKHAHAAVSAANQHFQDIVCVAASVTETLQAVPAARPAEGQQISAQGAAVSARKTRASAPAPSVATKTAVVSSSAVSATSQKTPNVSAAVSVEEETVKPAAEPVKRKSASVSA